MMNARILPKTERHMHQKRTEFEFFRSFNFYLHLTNNAQINIIYIYNFCKKSVIAF